MIKKVIFVYINEKMAKTSLLSKLTSDEFCLAHFRSAYNISVYLRYQTEQLQPCTRNKTKAYHLKRARNSKIFESFYMYKRNTVVLNIRHAQANIPPAFEHVRRKTNFDKTDCVSIMVV